METGERMVQRKLDRSSAVVAQRLEKLKTYRLLRAAPIIAALIVALFPFGYAFAQTAPVLSTSALVQKYCTDQGVQGATQIGTAQTAVTRVGCLDSSGNLINNREFDAVTRSSYYKDATGLDPGPLGVSADQIAAALPNLPKGTVPAGCQVWDVPCMGNAILVFVATLMMSLSAMLLTVAGSLFDLLITHTVIDFSGSLHSMGMLTGSDGSAGAIDKMWALFRDFANILIIGMFVFVAISTILSIENYGARKYIARILVVAVLINFSMFFTTFAIDVSNFISRQLYTTMPGISVAAKSSTSTLTTGNVDKTGAALSPQGIEGVFMQDIGISGVWNYGDLTDLTSKSGPLIMLGYTIGASLFMTVVALILLYGSFLLGLRAVLLVFLLITSSLAFASMLLPGKLGEEMWGKWRTSLINSAVFAPLLMLFLAATLVVLAGATAMRGTGTLPEFLRDPASTDGWSVLFLFIVASGMLFISIKVANIFATKLAGYNYATAIPTLGLIAGSAATSIGLRNTVGRGATRLSEMQAERAQLLTGQGKHIRAGIANMLSGVSSRTGKASFNPLATKIGGAILAPAGGTKGPLGGVFKSAAGVGKGGFIEREKQTVKKQQELAEKLAPTKEQQAKIRQEAQTNATPEQQQEFNARNQEVVINEARKTALKTAHENAIRPVNEAVKAAAGAATANPADPAAQAELANAVAAQRVMEAQQKQAMNEAEAAIKSAKEAADKAERAFVPKEAIQTRDENMADVAHRRVSNIPYRAAIAATSFVLPWVKPQTAEKDKVAQKVRKAAKKKEETDKEKGRLQALVGDIPPAPTPPAGTPAP